MQRSESAGMIENRTFDELKVGDSASSSARTATKHDIESFAVISDDVNPAHMTSALTETGMLHYVIAHGMLAANLISGVLGMKLPDRGTTYPEQELHFRHPVDISDTITALNADGPTP